MPLARTLVLLLLLAGVACFALYAATGQQLWRRRGLMIVRWTVYAALGFFAVLMLQRLAHVV